MSDESDPGFHLHLDCQVPSVEANGTWLCLPKLYFKMCPKECVFFADRVEIFQS